MEGENARLGQTLMVEALARDEVMIRSVAVSPEQQQRKLPHFKSRVAIARNLAGAIKDRT